jgi:predicted RNA-binding Zn-ribbon protein involved in translation (DUF1610 family)
VRMIDLTPEQTSSVPCPMCGVAAGERCLLHSGGLRQEPHIDRKLSAAEAIDAKRYRLTQSREAKKYRRTQSLAKRVKGETPTHECIWGLIVLQVFHSDAYGSLGARMPIWALKCSNCKLSFIHSKIPETGILNYLMPVRPESPLGGSKVKCPNCGKKATYDLVAVKSQGQ